jgi:hypothetical protein
MVFLKQNLKNSGDSHVPKLSYMRARGCYRRKRLWLMSRMLVARIVMAGKWGFKIILIFLTIKSPLFKIIF